VPTIIGPGWTPERVEKLRELWSSGLSASQCAAELGGGITRNAAIAKVHRLGIAERSKGRQGGVKSTKTKTKAASPPRAPTPAPAVPTPTFVAPPAPALRLAPIEQAFAKEAPSAPPPGPGVTLIELRLSSCRFPIGDPRDESFRFCGAPRETMDEHRMYCPAHAAVCYRPQPPRKPKPKEGFESRRLLALKVGMHQFAQRRRASA
jgi:GcrA cell cycle regulator